MSRAPSNDEIVERVVAVRSYAPIGFCHRDCRPRHSLGLPLEALVCDLQALCGNRIAASLRTCGLCCKRQLEAACHVTPVDAEAVWCGVLGVVGKIFDAEFEDAGAVLAIEPVDTGQVGDGNDVIS